MVFTNINLSKDNIAKLKSMNFSTIEDAIIYILEKNKDVSHIKRERVINSTTVRINVKTYFKLMSLLLKISKKKQKIFKIDNLITALLKNENK